MSRSAAEAAPLEVMPAVDQGGGGVLGDEGAVGELGEVADGAERGDVGLAGGAAGDEGEDGGEQHGEDAEGDGDPEVGAADPGQAEAGDRDAGDAPAVGHLDAGVGGVRRTGPGRGRRARWCATAARTRGDRTTRGSGVPTQMPISLQAAAGAVTAPAASPAGPTTNASRMAPASIDAETRRPAIMPAATITSLWSSTTVQSDGSRRAPVFGSAPRAGKKSKRDDAPGSSGAPLLQLQIHRAAAWSRRPAPRT